MTAWLFTVWIVYSDVNKVWLQRLFETQEECLRYQDFYNEYPFRTECRKVSQ